MRKTVGTVAVLATLALLTAYAQDSKATLDAVATAMGATNLNQIQYSGTGSNGAYGQAYAPGGAWPMFKVTSYVATIYYSVPAMSVELERTNPDGPARGGGGLPLVAPQTQNQAVSGGYAWNVNAAPAPGQNANVPALAAAPQRLLDLWTTPHGVIQAAIASKATVAGRVASFTLNGTPIKVTFSLNNLVSKVEWTSNAAVLGDVANDITYSMYKDFGRVKFPTRIVQRQGGFPILDLTITDVKLGGTNAVTVPANVTAAATAASAAPAAAPAPPIVTTTKVADGVFYLQGGTHHSMAVEFKDYSVLFEAPNNDDRAMAVIEATKKAVPNKPIKYVINSHNHFDHLGGVRAAMAEGLTIITQAANKPYYEKVAVAPHTLGPDLLSKTPKAPAIETVLEKRVITDGTQTLEIYRMPTDHTSTMLVGYIPKAKILYEVDLFNGPAAGAAPPAPAPVNPATLDFYNRLQTMKLDVDQILAGHGGRIATMKDLQAAVGR